MNNKPFPLRLISIFGLAIAIALAGGFWFYNAQQQSLQRRVEFELQSVAKLKVDQIVMWRAERLGDANVLMDNVYLTDAIARWLVTPTAQDAQLILSQFQSLHEHDHYANVELADSSGQIRLSLDGETGSIHAGAELALAQAFLNHQAALTDLHLSPNNQTPRLDVIAPLFAQNGAASKSMGAILLEVDARQYLYPLIQSWPTPSASAETLLVRRDGNDVLFLNDVRYQKGAALTLRVPLSKVEVPAVQAVLGKAGVFSGKDYRGAPVLSVISAVPDSSWFMVSKMDTAEAFADWRKQSVIILILIALFTVAIIAAAGFIWQGNERAHYQSLMKTQTNLRESEERFRLAINTTQEGLWEWDIQTHREFFAPRWCEIVGYSFDDPEFPHTYDAWASRIHPDDRERVISALKDHLEKGAAYDVNYRHRHKSGEYRWQNSKGQAVFDEAGKPTKMVGVISDITERKQAEDALQKAHDELELRVQERTLQLAMSNEILAADINERKQAESQREAALEKLRASEENYRTLAESMPDMIFIIDREDRVQYVNTLGARQLGATPEEMIGKPRAALFHTTINDLQAQSLRRVFESGESSFSEVPLRYGERELWVSRSLAPLRDPAGAVTAVMGISRDITERRRMEDKLRESEEHFRFLVEGVKDYAIIMLDPQGIVASWNKGAELLKGYLADEIIGQNFSRFYTEEDIRAGIPESLLQTAATQGKAESENWRVRKDGAKFWADVILTSIYDENRQLRGFAKITRDITERKRVEDKIKKSEERYRTTLDNMLEGCQIIGFDWRFLYINAEAERQNNRPSVELMGQNYIEMWPGIESTNVFQVIKRCMEKRTAEHFENQFAFPDGSMGWFELNIQPVPEGVLILSSDITARKRADEERLARETAERANLAKSEFLSRMSHELRTPLNSILGFTQLLQMDELNADQTGSLNQILKSGRHLLNLINEVLDISRIESGNLAISPEPVHLAEALESAVDIIRPLAEKRGISIEIKIPSSRDVFVTSDEKRLKQVLLNLLSNAVKYNHENGKIFVTANLQIDGILHLAVRDTGAGIAPVKMNRLFTAFDRLELEPDLIEGTGLGLALSKGLVEAMGGKIGADSAVGKGSIFWIDLELTTPQKEAIVMSEVEDYLKANPAQKKGRVLYVEDNLSNIQLIEKILARLPNVELISAMQGSLALDLARTHSPALILLDLHLPDMHGEDVLHRLRAEQETKDIPIVIMSADATQGQMDHMLSVGANAYLTKPIDVKEFLKMVGGMLGA